jgi:hypothetical protein
MNLKRISTTLLLAAATALLLGLLTASPPAHAAIGSDTPIPATPSNLKAKAAGTTSVKLTWTNNAANQSGVVISLDGVTSVNVPGATVSSYTWKKLSPGTKYWFYVASKIYGTPGDPTGPGNTQSAWVGPAYATTTSKLPPPKPTPVPNFNYAGYSVHAEGAGLWTIAAANWTVPKVDCSRYASPDAPRTAVWVGLWGSIKSMNNGTGWLPQTGTVSECNINPHNSKPDKGTYYYAVWEIAAGSKEPGNKQQPLAMPVHPGDRISAAVEFEGAGPNGTWEFEFSVFDINDNQRQPGSGTFDQVEDTPGPIAVKDLDTILQQGGAIVESNPPEHSYPNGLAQFNPPVRITGMQVASEFAGALKPTAYGYYEWILCHATKTGKIGPLLAKNSPSTITGVTSSFPGLLSYTITWKRTS